MSGGSSNFDLISIGDATIDAFLKLHDLNEHYRFDKEKNELCFHYGEKILIDQSIFLPGGNANNVAVGASRLGLKTLLVSEVGDDEFSEIIIKNLKKENINTSFIKQTAGAQANFAIVLSFQNDRIIFVRHVPREHNFSLTGISTKWVYLTSMGEEWQKPYQDVLAFVKRSGARLAFNPGSPQLKDGAESFIEVTQQSEVFFVNKDEALEIFNLQFSIFNEDSIKQMLNGIKQKGPKVVVITDGSNGSYAIDQNGEMYHISCFPGEAVQKAGAGDAYTSGFLSAIILGNSVQEAMRWGAVNATAVVQKIGAQTGLLQRQEISEKIRKNEGFKAEEI